jgi:hypothetical protein
MSRALKACASGRLEIAMAAPTARVCNGRIMTTARAVSSRKRYASPRNY